MVAEEDILPPTATRLTRSVKSNLTSNTSNQSAIRVVSSTSHPAIYTNHHIDDIYKDDTDDTEVAVKVEYGYDNGEEGSENLDVKVC